MWAACGTVRHQALRGRTEFCFAEVRRSLISSPYTYSAPASNGSGLSRIQDRSTWR